MLTFDDGYENVYWYAYPILKQKRIPFEIFAIGGLIGCFNDFDCDEPLTRFASRDQLVDVTREEDDSVAYYQSSKSN